jgi:hypothetical protein
MDLTIRDVSSAQVVEDASLIFISTETILPKETFLKKEIFQPYLNTLYLLLFISAKENNFTVSSYQQFSVFLSYIVKSTLYFHYCFDHPIKGADSKLALMFGDLYLVKGGEQLVKIKNFLRLHPSFRELLYSISMAQRSQDKSKGLPKENFEKIITMSYGYIYRFALIAPYLYVKNQTFEKRKLTQLAIDTSLYLAWQVEPYLSTVVTKKEMLPSLLKKIKNNLGEEKYHEYNFDGWKSDIQKITGGNDSKN